MLIANEGGMNGISSSNSQSMICF